MTSVIFLTCASADNLASARLMIASLRSFGGDLAGAPVWIFASEPDPIRSLEAESTQILPLAVPDNVSACPFGKKVAACARAEVLAPGGTSSLAWIDPNCLIVQPPYHFALSPDHDAAFRPVHIRNVGLPPSEPLDAFWRGICSALGVIDIRTSVTSFVDGQLLRTYFNSHAFAINPALGLLRCWYERFLVLVSNSSFQAAACSDETHQVFLFQALLSALAATSIEFPRICLLPPTYNYPYHFQDRIPLDQRIAALNDLVCFTYEERDIHPNALTGIRVHEPLRSWLEARMDSPSKML